MLFVNRTLATLRKAEFGFFGVVVYTRTHTPRLWGHSCKAARFLVATTFLRCLFISWLMVGIGPP
jgi:hypothetical protein